MKAKKNFPQTKPYLLLSIGFEFIFVFMSLTALGWLYDLYAPCSFSQASGGTLVGLFLGFFGSLWHLLRRSQEFQLLQKQEEGASSPQAGAKQEISKSEKRKELSQDIEDLRKKLEQELDS